ncbi:MAG: D-tagatose 3-epimerase [Alphaproteobacteria bacterium MarineAlpha3_Bin7]|nr:MAG: D-tagatose 3-epimerase [Alphaproteobacteria bacterium MarineAlpha3_Bin7]|tara:strand:+ start:331 stop:1137 length:807 start_codon:yes stop_codon:yes gene_type:complete
MKISVSNIALQAYDQEADLGSLSPLGVSGVEIAPSRVWNNTWEKLNPTDVEHYRGLVEKADLEVVGLHSLFFDHPELGLFKADKALETLDYLTHLSKVCRDLGGTTLIYGGGRWRNGLPIERANEEVLTFLDKLLPKIETHGTIFCFEPLSKNDSDFINSAKTSIDLVESFNHPSFRVQLDAKALLHSKELNLETFIRASKYLVHFHANEPDLGILGSSGKIDHYKIGKMLKLLGYSSYVSLEQKMISSKDRIGPIKRSLQFIKDSYI